MCTMFPMVIHRQPCHKRINWSAIGAACIGSAAFLGVAVLALFVAYCLTGCAPHLPKVPSMPSSGFVPPSPTMAGFGILSWLGAVCAVVAVVTFVLSFVFPALLLSWKLSLGCLAAAVGLWTLQAVLVAFFRVLPVVAVVAAGIAVLVWGLPYIVAMVRHTDLHAARGMLQNGHASDGLALVRRVYAKDAAKVQRFIDKCKPAPAPQNPDNVGG